MDYKKLFETNEDYVILPGARVCGDVVIGKGCSIWYNAVVRADESAIVIGDESNIQDNCVLHVDEDMPLQIGKGVTVGHGAILHGCQIDDNTLIGMGSIVLSGAAIGKNCIIGAGSLVTGGTKIPDGWIAYGRPARPVSRMTEKDIEGNRKAASDYAERGEKHR